MKGIWARLEEDRLWFKLWRQVSTWIRTLKCADNSFSVLMLSAIITTRETVLRDWSFYYPRDHKGQVRLFQLVRILGLVQKMFGNRLLEVACARLGISGTIVHPFTTEELFKLLSKHMKWRRRVFPWWLATWAKKTPRTQILSFFKAAKTILIPDSTLTSEISSRKWVQAMNRTWINKMVNSYNPSAFLALCPTLKLPTTPSTQRVR